MKNNLIIPIKKNKDCSKFIITEKGNVIRISELINIIKSL